MSELSRARSKFSATFDYAVDDIITNNKFIKASQEYYRTIHESERELASKAGWSSLIRTAVFLATAFATGGLSIPVSAALSVGAAAAASWGYDQYVGDISIEGGPSKQDFESRYNVTGTASKYADLEQGWDQAKFDVRSAEADIDRSHYLESLKLGAQFFGMKLLGAMKAPTTPDFSSVTYDVSSSVSGGMSVPVNITEAGTFISTGANMGLVDTTLTQDAETMIQGAGFESYEGVGGDIQLAPEPSTGSTSESFDWTPDDDYYDYTDDFDVIGSTDGGMDMYSEASDIIAQQFEVSDTMKDAVSEFYQIGEQTGSNFAEKTYKDMMWSYDDYYDEMLDLEGIV